MYWMLSFVPFWTIHLILVIGLIGLFIAAFVQHVPFISQYKFPIQIVALILTLGGVYLEGAIGYKQSVAIEVAELRQKLAEAEAESAKTNTEIVERVVRDTQVIRERGRTITEYVDREVVKYDDTCQIPDEVINAHNMAATLNLNTEATGENN